MAAMYEEVPSALLNDDPESPTEDDTVTVYLPKEVRGHIVLWQMIGDTWRITNANLKSENDFIAYRRGKNLDDRTNPEMHAKYETVHEGVDEGDGWVRFQVPKEAENNLATYGDRNKVMTTQEETFKMATEDLLQRQIEGRPRRSRSRPSIYGDTKVEKIRGTLKKTNAEKKKAKEEALKLRAEGLAIIFNHKGANQLTRKGLYQAFAMHTFWARLRTPGKIEESDFVKFFEKCTMARKPDGQEADRLSREDASRLFFNLKCDNKDHLTKEEFMDSIRRFMKVVKATALTEEINIERETTTLRRLGVGEVLEVLSGPTKVRLLVDDDQHQNEEIERLKVQVVMDDQEGWVTAIGNKGTVRLEEYLPAELELAFLLARKQAPEPYTWSDYFFWAVVAFVVGFATGGSLYMLMRLL